jgi:hypothetical protein
MKFEPKGQRQRRRRFLSTNFWKVVVCVAILLEVQLAVVWFSSDITSKDSNKNNNHHQRIVIEHVYEEGEKNFKGLSEAEIQTYLHRKPLFGPLLTMKNTTDDHDQSIIFTPDGSELENDRDKTIALLLKAGVSKKQIQDIQETNSIPPWSTIIHNYGKEPVILGLERCEAYRQSVKPKDRFVAPAGLFSTGTNLFHQLMSAHCKPHIHVRRPFVTWQAPWGKHNPEFARERYAPEMTAHHNQTACLPVLTVRHPYTWLESICIKNYNLIWDHDFDQCPKELSLHRKVNAQFGVAPETVYDSVAHAWKEWNIPYLEQQYYPILIIRHEDLVFRPKEVISKVCECVGGVMEKEFSYQTETAKKGHGHGGDRTDLLKAWTKYGQPLRRYRKRFNQRDWKVINAVLDKDHGMMNALHYPR